MRYVIAFFRFWRDFLIGDDWTIAASVAGALAASFWLVREGVAAWWLLPITAMVTLGVSLWRDAA